VKNREPHYPTFQPPADARALDDMRTRWALRQRFWDLVRRRRWILGPYAVLLVLLIASAETVGGVLSAAAGALVGLASFICVPLLIGTLAGLLRAVHMWWLLSSHPWREYDCSVLCVGEGTVGPVTLTVRRKGVPDRYFLAFQANRRRETLRGMVRPAVWIAGDPARRGVLVMAGGGELFLAHRQRSAYRAQSAIERRALGRRNKPARPAKPGKPPKPPKALTPAQRARADAKRVKQAAREKQRRAQEQARLARRRANTKLGARRSLFGRRQSIFGPGGTIGRGPNRPFKRR
jgi:hypothetical protein